jgi:predicted Fe-Mo cluster-binding NifX family protein
MKIAVACDEHGKVAEHFGRTACFEVFEYRDNGLVRQESRLNAHAAEGHGHETGGGHGGHAGILGVLADCQAMLCGGMGGRVAGDLARAGVKPMVVSGYADPGEAAKAYQAGLIKESGPFHKCCRE